MHLCRKYRERAFDFLQPVVSDAQWYGKGPFFGFKAESINLDLHCEIAALTASQLNLQFSQSSGAKSNALSRGSYGG
jgi:hypothetical protein